MITFLRVQYEEALHHPIHSSYLLTFLMSHNQPSITSLPNPRKNTHKRIILPSNRLFLLDGRKKTKTYCNQLKKQSEDVNELK